MASTNTLQRTVNYCQNFVRNAPLTFSGTNDPAFFNADWVRQFILSPPFSWRWNRGSAVIDLVQGQQDYTVSLPTFGWLEKASLVNAVAPPGGPQSWELEIATNIITETNQQVPTKVCAQSDDGNGNILIRLFPVPDRSYTLTLDFQAQSPTFKNLSDTWAPIPDYFSYLYNQGMLAKTYEYLSDSRFVESMTIFIRQLVSCSEGLDESQKNIFLNQKLDSMRQTIAVQQGKQGKNLL